MSTRIAAEDACWWWSDGAQSSHHGGCGGMADIQYPAASQLPALYVFHYYQQGGSHYIDEQNQNVGSEMECSRPQLRWSKELHEMFISAVNQLGGTSTATPKSIRNIMRVEDLTLFQIKSHLQKYRIGKISRRLTTRDHVDENKSMDMESCHSSFDINGDETSEVPKYENLNHMIEKKLGDDGNPRLFPPIPASNKHDYLYDLSEWSGLLDSSTDDYLNSIYHDVWELF